MAATSLGSGNFSAHLQSYCTAIVYAACQTSLCRAWLYFYCLIYFPCRISSFSLVFPCLIYLILLLKGKKASTRNIVSSIVLLWIRNEFLFPNLLPRGSPSVANTTARLVADIWGKIISSKAHFKLMLSLDVHTNMKTHMHIHKQERICTFLSYHHHRNKL